jgi:sugar lactone lactonase YvrE
VATVAAPVVAQTPQGAGPQVTTLTDTIFGSVGGIAVDGLGVVYVADFGDNVWRVTRWGDMTLHARGQYGSSGNAVDSRGNLLQANFNGNYISRISRAGEISVFASGLQGPVGIAIDPQDNLFVNNCRANSLSRVTPSGEVTGFAKSDLLNCPNGITFGPQGNLYVVNFSDGRMLKVTPAGEVSEFALIPGGGNGHVAFANGTFHVTGFRSNRIYAVGLDGQVSIFAGTGQPGTVDGPGLEAQFASPNGIARNRNGTILYVNDYLTPFQQRGKVPPRSIVRMIQLPSLTQQFLVALQSGGLEAAMTAYRDFKQSNPNTFTEVETNALGYRLMQQGNVPAAIEVFKLNVEDYPKSWNVYDSLAEAYMNAGQNEQAIQYYEKSIELNPANTNGIDMLKKLGAR